MNSSSMDMVAFENSLRVLFVAYATFFANIFRTWNLWIEILWIFALFRWKKWFRDGSWNISMGSQEPQTRFKMFLVSGLCFQIALPRSWFAKERKWYLKLPAISNGELPVIFGTIGRTNSKSIHIDVRSIEQSLFFASVGFCSGSRRKRMVSLPIRGSKPSTLCNIFWKVPKKLECLECLDNPE